MAASGRGPGKARCDAVATQKSYWLLAIGGQQAPPQEPPHAPTATRFGEIKRIPASPFSERLPGPVSVTRLWAPRPHPAPGLPERLLLCAGPPANPVYAGACSAHAKRAAVASAKHSAAARAMLRAKQTPSTLLLCTLSTLLLHTLSTLLLHTLITLLLYTLSTLLLYTLSTLLLYTLSTLLLYTLSTLLLHTLSTLLLHTLSTLLLYTLSTHAVAAYAKRTKRCHLRELAGAPLHKRKRPFRCPLSRGA
jgi:hypothetical protein